MLICGYIGLFSVTLGLQLVDMKRVSTETSAV
jgi:hypothetical protein